MTSPQDLGDTALSLRGVGVRYTRRGHFFRREHFWAVQDVSFEVRHGETLGLIGRNGAGKSTLMRVMAGIISPDCGCFDDHGLVASLHSLNVGFVPYLSGRENAYLAGLLLGMRRAEVAERMGAILEFSGLGASIDRPIATYSSGMLARLGFSIAFQVQPDVLLVDEVWGVGDQEFRQRSTEAMRAMATSQRTVVLVSHNLDLVRRFCNRVVWIEDGTTRGEGRADEVVDAYLRSVGPGTG